MNSIIDVRIEIIDHSDDYDLSVENIADDINSWHVPDVVKVTEIKEPDIKRYGYKDVEQARTMLNGATERNIELALKGGEQIKRIKELEKENAALSAELSEVYTRLKK